MRARLLAVTSAALLTLCLTACDSVQQATDAANNAMGKADVCAQALKLAGFNPDTANPEQAAKDAEKTAKDLSALADKAADTTLKDAINGMADKVNELSTQTITPSNVTAWAKEKVAAVDALSQACLS